MRELLRSLGWSNTKSAFLAAIFASVPLLFSNAFLYGFPMGYAGLFTQMAQQIADANFALPSMSPFYGPGGIPFAYPPLGLYLLAVFIKLTGKYYIFLRFLPPIFSLIAVGLTFFLAQKFFKQPFLSMLVAILTATSLDLYVAHTWSSGIVRAPAFIFTILVLYFYSPNPDERSLQNIFLSGLFFGLAAISHLAYALFCFFWIVVSSISFRDWKKTVVDPFLAGLTALAVASIWVVSVAVRYGWNVFFGAFNSHSGDESIVEALNFTSLVHLFQVNLAPILSNPLLAVLVLMGGIYLLLHKQYRFTFFFLLIVLAFPENARFVYWLGCFIAAYGLWFFSAQFYDWLLKHTKLSQPVWMAIMITPVVGFLWWGGLSSILRFEPFLSNSAIELQERSSEIFLKDGAYLALLIQDEAEWLPFLVQHEPLVSQWGSEWLGTYNEQTRLMSMFQGCRKEKDWACVNSVLTETGSSPEYIITYRIDKKMNEQIAQDGRWREVFSNERYTVWEVGN